MDNKKINMSRYGYWAKYYRKSRRCLVCGKRFDNCVEWVSLKGNLDFLCVGCYGSKMKEFGDIKYINDVGDSVVRSIDVLNMFAGDILGRIGVNYWKGECFKRFYKEKWFVDEKELDNGKK